MKLFFRFSEKIGKFNRGQAKNIEKFKYGNHFTYSCIYTIFNGVYSPTMHEFTIQTLDQRKGMICAKPSDFFG